MLTRIAWVAALMLLLGSADRNVHGEDITQKLPNAGTPSTSTDKSDQLEVRKPVKPKELSDTVKKGLDYLVGQQHEDGGFGQGGGWRSNAEASGGRIEGKEVKDPPDVGNTCMAALALIRAGNTPKNGKFSKQLVKAIEFIEIHVESADKDSLYVTPIRDTQLQSKIGRYLDTFLAAQVLSEVKGQMPDTKSEDRLFAALNKTIGKIESNQQADGTFAGNSGWASVLSQGVCSKALSRAAQKGVAVKATTIKRDLDQTVAQLTASDPVAAGAPAAVSTAIDASKISKPVAGFSSRLGAAGAVSSMSSAKGDAGVQLYFLAANGGRVQDTVNANKGKKSEAKAILSSPTADDKSKQAAQVELDEVMAVEKANGAATQQLVANLGDAKFLQGFGNNGGEEFLSYMNISETLLAQGGEAWEKWDRQVSESVTKCQNGDGSWSGHHCITGRTFCTSAALLTMMADRAPMPVVAEAVSKP